MNNNSEESFGQLESHEFSAIVNLASNFKIFVRILAEQQAVQDLLEQMSNSEVRLAVSERALSLVHDPGQEGYEHPWDCALAAYLWLLAGAESEQAIVLVSNIAKALNCR